MDALNKNSKAAAEEKPKARFRTRDISIRKIYSNDRNFYSMPGIEQLEDLRSLNNRIRMKILMTMRQKNQTSLQVEAWLKESSGQDCFVTAVRRSIIAEKATMQRVPLPKFSKNCIVTQDYRNVVTELLKDMEG